MRYFFAFLDWAKDNPRKILIATIGLVLISILFVTIQRSFASIRVMTVSPQAQNQIPLDQEFIIQFSGEVSGTVLDSIQITPSLAFEASLLKKDLMGRSKTLSIRPVGMVPDASYTVDIPSIKSWLGISSGGLSFSFSTVTTPALLGTAPRDGATQVDVASSITIQFNQPVDLSSVQIDMEPDVPIQKQPAGAASILIVPESWLTEETLYTVTVYGEWTGDLSRSYTGTSSFSFTTTVKKQSQLTEDEQVSQQVEASIIFNQHLQEYLKDPLPKVLAHIPYSTDQYSIDFDHQTREFIIILKQKPEAANTQKALTWLNSQGMTRDILLYRVVPLPVDVSGQF